jgi:hypothetical protein
MYLLHVNPRESAKWVAPPPDQLVTTEKLVRRASRAADTEQNIPEDKQELAPGRTSDSIV